MASPKTVADLARSFLTGRSADEVLSLRLGDLGVTVRTNSPELKAKLADYFRDFLDVAGGAPAETTIIALEMEPPKLDLPLAEKAPEPGKSKVKEEFADLSDGRIVRKRLTGMVFCFGGELHLALGPCLANHNQVVNFVNNRYIEHLVKRGALLFHAAGVAVGGAGLALAGFSGMGKSTLALHVMQLGADFVSNDRLMVERAGGRLTMHGVAKMPRVNPGTVLHNPSLAPVIPDEEREGFEELSPDELWTLEHKYDAFIDECFGPGRFRLISPMAGLVLLNWRRDAGPLVARRVNLAQRPDLLPAFMKSVGLFFEMDARMSGRDFSEAAYLNLLDGCPVLELSGGVDFEAAARACLEFLVASGRGAA